MDSQSRTLDELQSGIQGNKQPQPVEDSKPLLHEVVQLHIADVAQHVVFIETPSPSGDSSCSLKSV